MDKSHKVCYFWRVSKTTLIFSDNFCLSNMCTIYTFVGLEITRVVVGGLFDFFSYYMSVYWTHPSLYCRQKFGTCVSGAAVYRGPMGSCPPFFTAVYTALEIHFCKLLCYSFLLALIYSVYPIIFSSTMYFEHVSVRIHGQRLTNV